MIYVFLRDFIFFFLIVFKLGGKCVLAFSCHSAKKKNKGWGFYLIICLFKLEPNILTSYMQQPPAWSEVLCFYTDFTEFSSFLYLQEEKNITADD